MQLYENSLELSVSPDRGEREDILAVLQEIGGEMLVARLLGEQSGEVEQALSIVRHALANILNPSRGSTPALEAAIVGLAIGYPGLESMAAVAKNHGVGRAAISKRVITLCDELNLPASPYMKAASTRATYRKTNVRKRSRK